MSTNKNTSQATNQTPKQKKTSSAAGGLIGFIILAFFLFQIKSCYTSMGSDKERTKSSTVTEKVSTPTKLKVGPRPVVYALKLGRGLPIIGRKYSLFIRAYNTDTSTWSEKREWVKNGPSPFSTSGRISHLEFSSNKQQTIEITY